MSTESLVEKEESCMTFGFNMHLKFSKYANGNSHATVRICDIVVGTANIRNFHKNCRNMALCGTLSLVNTWLNKQEHSASKRDIMETIRNENTAKNTLFNDKYT